MPRVLVITGKMEKIDRALKVSSDPIPKEQLLFILTHKIDSPKRQSGYCIPLIISLNELSKVTLSEKGTHLHLSNPISHFRALTYHTIYETALTR